jgi:oligopeptide transport system permease protein
MRDREIGAPGGPASATDVVAAVEAEASLTRDAWRDMRRNPLFIVSVVFVAAVVIMALFPQWIAGWFGHGDPRACDLGRSAQGPTAGHPFGFDVQGCDLYANVVYGTRTSVSVGLLATGLCFVVAVVLGSLSGYWGRALDAVLSRLGDIFFGFPFILGAIVLLTTFRERGVLVVAAVLTVFAWPTVTRLMRATVIEAKTADYVMAAKVLGATHSRILVRHVLPNALTPVVVLSSLTIGGYIAGEAALTYLGVGLQYPDVSWGLQLSAAQSRFGAHPHLLVFPAAFLSFTVISFVLLGDILRDAFDPKSR